MNKNIAAPAGEGGWRYEDQSQWARMPREGFTLRGLGRSFLYQLCKAGQVRSIVLEGPTIAARGRLPKRKSKRGVRLVHLPSLDAYLAEQLAAQSQPIASSADAQ